MVVDVVLCVPSTLADATDLNAREFAVVLPFGAVLAGRPGRRPARPSAPAALPQPPPGPPCPSPTGWRARSPWAVAARYAASLGWAAGQASHTAR